MMNGSIADRLEIHELTARYAHAMDGHDAEKWLETWCADGKWEGALGTYIGKQNLPQLLRDLGERNEGRRHVITNHVIDFSGPDEAALKCYMQIFAYKGGCRVVATAVYHDVLRKEEGRWLFLHRRLILDS